MGKKYTITIVVEDNRDEYGDPMTLGYYVNDVMGPSIDALDLTIVSIDVKGKRN